MLRVADDPGQGLEKPLPRLLPVVLVHPALEFTDEYLSSSVTPHTELSDRSIHLIRDVLLLVLLLILTGHRQLLFVRLTHRLPGTVSHHPGVSQSVSQSLSAAGGHPRAL